MPRWPVTFGRATTEMVDRHAEQPGDHERLVPRRCRCRGRCRSSAYDGSSGAAAVDVHGWISKPAKFAAHDERGRAVDEQVVAGLAVVGERVRPAAHPRRRVGRDGLVPEAALGASMPSGKRLRLIGRPARDGDSQGATVA